MSSAPLARGVPAAAGSQPPARWPGGHPRRRRILLVLCLSLLVVVIDNTILNTALPTLARVLHAGTSSLQWITDAYTLCFAALLVPAGALGDRYGRRLSLIGGLTVFALGSTLAAVASGTGMLIGARLVMGLGAAFVMPATLSILNAVFPPQERPQAIAAWSAVAGVGIVIGPTLGGLLLAHFWWGSVFLINVPLVALALAGVALTVPETAEPGGHRLDLVGTVLVAGSLFAIVDAIIEAPSRGWTAPLTLAEAVAGLAALGVFAWWELRTAHPLIDLRVFAVRAFSASAGAVTVIFFALFGSLFVLTQYLQLVHGYSPLAAGVRALPFALAMAAASPISPVLAGRLGSRVVIPAGMALMGGGLLDLSTAGVHTAYPQVALAVAIMGAGMGLVMAPASTTIMTTVPAHQAGAGSAINDTIREVGGALGVAIVGSLAAAVYHSRLSSTLAAAKAPGAVVHQAASSVAAADIIGRQVGGAAGGELVAAAHSAFVTAMAMGIRVAAVVALAAAVAAVVALPRRPRPEPQPVRAGQQVMPKLARAR
ncbi:MAG: MFS transporter [Streptosporangiaceae bacterium]|jgi:EmrB/QacA subfamily drug resistance transporter|nr:MFS transporter [Actinomycetota bacterium]